MSDTDELGPAMSALNEKQRAFVMAMVEHPGISQAEAARLAGYSDVSDGAKVRGHHCAHNPAVQEAIREVAGLRLNANSLLAADVLVAIASDAEAPTKDRLKAAGMLLDRTGFGAVQNINVNKTVTNITDKEIDRRLQKAAEALARLGFDPSSFVMAASRAEPVLIEGKVEEMKNG